jgi:hypothetical protein
MYQVVLKNFSSKINLIESTNLLLLDKAHWFASSLQITPTISLSIDVHKALSAWKLQRK